MSPIMQVFAGIQRHYQFFVRALLEALGAIWLVLEVTSFFYAPARNAIESNYWVLIGAALIAMAYAVWRARAPNSITISVPGSNTDVTVKFGDLFAAEDEHFVVPANNHFDGELGVTVDAASIHGQFIQRVYNGAGKEFERACDNQLRNVESEEVSERKRRKKFYPIGTSVALPLNGRKAFVFALSETNPETHKARADVPIMWEALAGLWQCARDGSNGHAVNVPLVGAGQSGVGLEPPHLLRLIILSIQVATRQQEICKHIQIILHPNMVDKIDLHSVKKEWS